MSQKKQSTHKTTRTSQKKTESRRTPKRATRTQSSQKKTASTKPAKKIAAKKKISTQTRPSAANKKKLRPKKKGTLQNNSPMRLPHSVSLSQLNPFRLPIPIDQMTISAARVAGLVFAMLIAVFTAYHVQSVVGIHEASNRAQVIDMCTDLSPDARPDHCGSSTTAHERETQQGAVYTHNVQPLSGIVDVTIDLPDISPDATVWVWARGLTETGSGADLLLGKATHTHDKSWRLAWETRETVRTSADTHYPRYPDGTYQLAAAVVYKDADSIERITYIPYGRFTYTLVNSSAHRTEAGNG